MLKSISIAFTLILASTLCAAEPTAKPNIIVIMADDLGYGDVSCYGAKRIQTPNIDKLAVSGRRFTSGYTTASTCTPTRYSFLTGTYAFRTPRTGIAPPNAAAIIKPGTDTLPSLLKKAGYTTAIVGKWHLGFGETAPDWNGELKPGPLEIGFDHCFVLPTTNDRVPPVIVEDHRVRNLDPKDPLWVGDTKPSEDHPTGITERAKLRMDWSHGHNNSVHNGIGRIGFFTGGKKALTRDEDLADEWIGHSVKWIEKNRDKPFFLFYASQDLHVPRMPHERFQKKSDLGFRGDAILEFDWQVGELTKTLDRLNLTENTLVVVCSDNGPVLDDGYIDGAKEKLGDHKPAGPYRGGKTTVFEGGTRIPFITSWKGRIKPAVVDLPVSTIDFAASFAKLANVELPEKACPDSLELLGTLLGEPGAKGREFVLSQDNGGGSYGLRNRRWKLVRNKAAKMTQEMLFDLEKDPAEATNVAKANDKELARMRKILDDILKGEQTRPTNQ